MAGSVLLVEVRGMLILLLFFDGESYLGRVSFLFLLLLFLSATTVVVANPC